MASRALITSIDDPQFEVGFKGIERDVASEGISQLLAIDLIVRISSLAKKLKSRAKVALSAALQTELPPCSLIVETSDLPNEAKPAEVRENVAMALAYASGSWVLPYIIRSLAEEERSQRCRLELAQQLATRERSIDRWLKMLRGERALQWRGTPDDDVEGRVAKLRDISAALADAVRKNRSQMIATQSTGSELAALCQTIVRVDSASPKNLSRTAVEVIKLLDEIFAVKLTLIVEPAAYSILEDFWRWWHPLPYPKPLTDALVPILGKLLTGITLRARMGQQSDALLSRLRQAYGDADAANRRLVALADDEVGLAPEIQDWLRGRSRIGSLTGDIAATALRNVANQELAGVLATLFLETHTAKKVKEDRDDSANSLQRLDTIIHSAALRNGLKIVGEKGDRVEFSSLAHETVDGQVPAEPHVVLVRPMVVRQRQDGSRDVLIKALVTADDRE